MIVRDRGKPFVQWLSRRSVLVGEVGLPPVGPAVANALETLAGGVRLQRYPLRQGRANAASRAAA
jgi:hypothetical protein